MDEMAERLAAARPPNSGAASAGENYRARAAAPGCCMVPCRRGAGSTFTRRKGFLRCPPTSYKIPVNSPPPCCMWLSSLGRARPSSDLRDHGDVIGPPRQRLRPALLGLVAGGGRLRRDRHAQPCAPAPVLHFFDGFRTPRSSGWELNR